MALMLAAVSACVAAAGEPICASRPDKGAVEEQAPASVVSGSKGEAVEECPKDWALINPAQTKEQIENPFRFGWREWTLLTVWLTLVLVHSVVVWRLARLPQAAPRRLRMRRVGWLLLLAVVNPLPLISSAIVLMLAVKIWLDGSPTQLAPS